MEYIWYIVGVVSQERELEVEQPSQVLLKKKRSWCESLELMRILECNTQTLSQMKDFYVFIHVVSVTSVQR